MIDHFVGERRCDGAATDRDHRACKMDGRRMMVKGGREGTEGKRRKLYRANRWVPGCVNAAGKARQKWQVTPVLHDLWGPERTLRYTNVSSRFNQ